jgi:molecular chaperone GrpE (heat shock protein)
MKLHISQVPSNDFRSGGIANAIAEDLKNHYERQTAEIIDSVMDDASGRLIEIAERLKNACTEPEADDDGKVKRKKIYDTTVTQAKEICQTLKAFNLTNNSALNAAVHDLAFALDGVGVEELRESAYTRKEVRESIDDMLTKFKPLKAYN